MQGGYPLLRLLHQGNDFGYGFAGSGQPQARFFTGKVQKFAHTRVYRQQLNVVSDYSIGKKKVESGGAR